MQVDFQFVPLTDLVEVNPSVDFSNLKSDGLVSFIPMADVSEAGQWIDRKTRRLCEVKGRYTPFQEGDVLFSKITPCMENGKGCHAINLVNGVGFGTTEFHVIRAKPIADSRFIYHIIQFEELRLKAEGMMTGSAGQRRVPAEFFEKYQVRLFPLPEQCRIAEILDSADEAIQRTEAVITKLKQIKAGLLHDLLTCGLDEHGKLRDPIAHPEQFKDSPLGRIPRGWEVPTIGSLTVPVSSGLTPRGGKEVYKTEGVLFIRSQNVTFEGLLLNEVAYIDVETHRQMKRSQVHPHDVFLNITGASIGRCCPFPDGLGEANVNQHVYPIRLPTPNLYDAIYLSAVLASRIGQSQIARLNAGGNREGLNYQQLRSFIIPWPEAKERARIAEVLSAHDARIRAEEAYRDKLKQQKKGLMHDLLTGRVRV